MYITNNPRLNDDGDAGFDFSQYAVGTTAMPQIDPTSLPFYDEATKSVAEFVQTPPSAILPEETTQTIKTATS